jgi:Retrotransposon gag protein
MLDEIPTWHGVSVWIDELQQTRVTAWENQFSRTESATRSNEPISYPIRQFDNLPPHIKGKAVWDPRMGQGTGSYSILDTTLTNPARGPVELINGRWYMIRYNRLLKTFQVKKNDIISEVKADLLGLGRWNEAPEDEEEVLDQETGLMLGGELLHSPQPEIIQPWQTPATPAIPVTVQEPSAPASTTSSPQLTPLSMTLPLRAEPPEPMSAILEGTEASPVLMRGLSPDPLPMSLSPIVEDVLAAVTDALVTVQETRRMEEDPILTTAPLIEQQVYQIHGQGYQLPVPQITQQAAPPPVSTAVFPTVRFPPTNPTVPVSVAVPVTPTNPKPRPTELIGLPPTIFSGNRNKSDLFLKEFKQWKMLNRNTPEMSVPFDRVLMALSHIRGNRVNDWHKEQLTKLEGTALMQTDEQLWADFETAFKSAFTDSSKRQTAYEQLKGHHMHGTNVDTYIARFETLIKQAGWSRTDAGAIDLFRNGLMHNLKEAILSRETWPETLDDWERMAREEQVRELNRRVLLVKREAPKPRATQLPVHRHIEIKTPQETPSVQVNITTITPSVRQKKPKTALKNRTCYHCRVKGHEKAMCPDKGLP